MTDTDPLFRPTRILLDMDGVLVDFITAAARVHGREHVLPDWPLGTWEAHDVFGISMGEFWKAIDARGADFWARLEPFPWADELFHRLNQIAPVTIATSPSHEPACLEGKVRWLQGTFGRKFRDFMIGPSKHLLARTGAVLVDDSPRNIRDFRNAGGHGVLFPQPWNENHRWMPSRLEYVLSAVASGPAATSAATPKPASSGAGGASP